MVNSTRMGYYEASSSFGTNQQGDVLKSCLHGLILKLDGLRKRKNITYAHASAIVCARQDMHVRIPRIHPQSNFFYCVLGILFLTEVKLCAI